MSNRHSPTWIIESQVMPTSHPILKRAVAELGQALVEWNDDWWATGNLPRFDENAVLFHGSLENAARIKQELPWRPGAYCKTDAFRCSSWYPAAREWLVHERWRLLPASRFVSDADAVLNEFESQRVFVRPDSPLKPFAGRVLAREKISLAALDHGFYFDDPDLAVIVAPIRSIGREWRYVVVDQRVIAGSAYAADGRSALPDDPNGAPWQFAEKVARSIEPPEDVYVLDVCEADGALKLLELNPFSGADLYACNAKDVVIAVSKAAIR